MKEAQGKRIRKCVCLCTMLDVRFINNVRIAQFFRIINACRGGLRAIIMMIVCRRDS